MPNCLFIFVAGYDDRGGYGGGGRGGGGGGGVSVLVVVCRIPKVFN